MARILVVDDDEDLRIIAVEALEAAGHDVAVAADGLEAMALQRERAMDLVITDILMPEKEGIETIHDLRQEAPGLKIIAVSGGGKSGGVVYLTAAAEVGADMVLQKPFSAAVLVESVRQLLEAAEPGA